jgi:transposase
MGTKRGQGAQAEMHTVREILRLKMGAGLQTAVVAASCRVGHTSVRHYARRAYASGKTVAELLAMDDTTLRATLGHGCKRGAGKQFVADNWSQVRLELAYRKDTTLQLLWEEYQQREQLQQAYSYSQYCAHYRAFCKSLSRSLRQVYKAGERMLVDFCGVTVPIINRETGEVNEAEIFVATLGMSNYTYAEAVPDQSLPHWISAHTHAVEFFGGVTELVIPDNLKAAVTKNDGCEPEINRTYAEWARHYGTVIMPARPYEPRDKAKAETAVQHLQRRVLAALRHRTFFSLTELNEAIRELLERLNDKPFRRLPGSRRSWFAEHDRVALRKLPQQRYLYADWKKVRVHQDYHVELEHSWYSVPHELVGRQVQVRYTFTTVEVFHDEQRVASHHRTHKKFKRVYVDAHMPPAHREFTGGTAQRLQKRAQYLGPQVQAVIDRVLHEAPHPAFTYQLCRGMLSVLHGYSREQARAACVKAITLPVLSVKRLRALLEHPEREITAPPSLPGVVHENLRGAAYYGDAATAAGEAATC